MEGSKTTRLLKSINVNSPRLTNYRYLDPNLTHIAMGMREEKPLYIPWGGGIYGFYINKNIIPKENIPVSISEIWHWKNQYSLNKGQFWYNVGLALQSLGLHPFYLNELAKQGKRVELAKLTETSSKLQIKLNDLYNNAGELWSASPKFKKHLNIVSSWGPEINQQNKSGGNWQLIDFKEGKQAWLDTINFSKDLTGKKLEAAEIIANYFIGKNVQKRISEELSMIPASTKVENRGLLSLYPDIFKNGYFVPPFNKLAYSVMQQMILRAETQMILNKDEPSINKTTKID